MNFIPLLTSAKGIKPLFLNIVKKIQKQIQYSRIYLRRTRYILSVSISIVALLVPTPSAAVYFDTQNTIQSKEELQKIAGTSDFESGNFIIDKKDRNKAEQKEKLPKNSKKKIKKVIVVSATAYSSDRRQTDRTPFITASGKRVRDGIVAANFLPFGTKIRIPQYFGDKEFIVEDRMARRHKQRIDVWFEHYRDARNFGIKRSIKIEVIE